MTNRVEVFAFEIEAEADVEVAHWEAELFAISFGRERRQRTFREQAGDHTEAAAQVIEQRAVEIPNYMADCGHTADNPSASGADYTPSLPI